MYWIHKTPCLRFLCPIIMGVPWYHKIQLTCELHIVSVIKSSVLWQTWNQAPLASREQTQSNVKYWITSCKTVSKYSIMLDAFTSPSFVSTIPLIYQFQSTLLSQFQISHTFLPFHLLCLNSAFIYSQQLSIEGIAQWYRTALKTESRVNGGKMRLKLWCLGSFV